MLIDNLCRSNGSSAADPQGAFELEPPGTNFLTTDLREDLRGECSSAAFMRVPVCLLRGDHFRDLACRRGLNGLSPAGCVWRSFPGSWLQTWTRWSWHRFLRQIIQSYTKHTRKCPARKTIISHLILKVSKISRYIFSLV